MYNFYKLFYSYTLIIYLIFQSNFFSYRRYVSSSNSANFADLGVQLDVFHEQKENDEAQILDSPYGVDLNSHVDVFYAVLRQVSDSDRNFNIHKYLDH